MTDVVATPVIDQSELMKSPHPLESPRPFGGGGGGGGGSIAGGFGGGGFTPAHSSITGGQSVRGDRGHRSKIFSINNK